MLKTLAQDAHRRRVVTASVVAAAPAAAAIVANADEVDNKHAVGAGASRASRGGKLVATDSGGYLPNKHLEEGQRRHQARCEGLHGVPGREGDRGGCWQARWEGLHGPPRLGALPEQRDGCLGPACGAGAWEVYVVVDVKDPDVRTVPFFHLQNWHLTAEVFPS